MPAWGQVRYGSPYYGPWQMPPGVDEERAVYGGQAPWMPDFTMPWRAAQATIYGVEISDYSLQAALPAIGVGCRREAQLENDRYQSDALTLVLNDPVGYLPGGAYAGGIALSNCLRVVWSVESAGGGPLGWQSPVYRVLRSPSRDDGPLGSGPLTLVVADWLTTIRRGIWDPSGYLQWSSLYHRAQNAIIDGMPPIGSATTVATLTAGLLWNQGALGLVIDPTWTNVALREAPLPPPPPPEPLLRDFPGGGLAGGDVPVLITEPGKPATYGDVLDYLWDYEPFRITYDPQGRPALRPGLLRRGGPWVLSRDTSVPGRLALPWESLTRTVADASFTLVHYQVVPNDPTGTPSGASGIGGPSDASDVIFIGEAVSNSRVNPHLLEFPRTHFITERGPGRSTAAFGSAQAYAAWLLAQALGQADTLSIVVDSAPPYCDLGDELRVCAPPQVDGWYRLTAVSQPLDEGPATLTAQWVQDA